MEELYPKLKMEGRSGCRLVVFDKEGIFFVRKFSKEAGYNTRLLQQAQKQSAFGQNHLSQDFRIPQVLGISLQDEPLSWFEMPYLHAQTYSEFFERVAVSEIRKLAEKFNRYFAVAFANSTVSPVDEASIKRKIEGLHELLVRRDDIDKPLVQIAFNYLRQIPAATIPLRECHGDFTFSNMLFCEDGIYLVDFLDSFIESPLIDLVKFRQDTFFYWSLLIENKVPPDRSGKIIQIFNYLDHEIVKNLQNNKFVEQWYSYLQVFNLLRILPYVSHDDEIQFVQKGIQRII